MSIELKEGTRRQEIVTQLDEAFEHLAERFDVIAHDTTPDKQNQLFFHTVTKVGLRFFRKDPQAPAWESKLQVSMPIMRKIHSSFS